MDLPSGSDPEHFERLYRREHRAIVGLAYVFSGSAPVAEELAHDAFLVALRDWERVRRLEDLSAWIRRVVANRSASRFRRLAHYDDPRPSAPQAAFTADEREAARLLLGALGRYEAELTAANRSRHTITTYVARAERFLKRVAGT